MGSVIGGSVTREVVLPAGIDDVWEAITDPRRMSDWFGARVDLDLWPGGSAEFTTDDGEVRRGVVEEVEPGRRLAYRWWPEAADDADDADDATDESRVELTIEEVSSGTRLTVVEAPVVAFGGQASVAAPSAHHRSAMVSSAAGWSGRLVALVWATAFSPVAG